MTEFRVRSASDGRSIFRVLRLAVLVGVLMVLGGGCAGPEADDGVESVPGGSPGTTSESGAGLSPVEALGLVVRGGDDELTLRPYSYCWFGGDDDGCADGPEPDPLPVLTLSDAAGFSVEFALDWDIRATLLFDGEYCNGKMVVGVSPGSSASTRLGPAGRYTVRLSGQGELGDAGWVFELVTTRDSEYPPVLVSAGWVPAGLALEADTPFSIQIGNLRQPPVSSSAMVMVTASNGASREFSLPASEAVDCWSSSVGFEASDGFTAQVLALGPQPYDLAVTAVLDDRIYESDTIRWPNDWDNSNVSRRVAVAVDASADRDSDVAIPGALDCAGGIQAAESYTIAAEVPGASTPEGAAQSAMRVGLADPTHSESASDETVTFWWVRDDGSVEGIGTVIPAPAGGWALVQIDFCD